MSLKFIRVASPHGIYNCFVWKDKIYDITSLIGEDFSAAIEDGRMNDRQFIESLKKNTLDFEEIPIEYSRIQLNTKSDQYYLLMPIIPPEVWGVGVTYKKNRDLHEEDLSQEASVHKGLYDYVYKSKRPEIFFKALPHHCVGTHDFFTIRKDSDCTIVEAELACVLNGKGEIVGFTAANDITAWDIELECPLFLNYAKIFNASCVIGPSIVPACEMPNPINLDVKCTVFRNGEQFFEKFGNTKHLNRDMSDLTRYLTADRLISNGTILCTGTAVGVPSHLNCEVGDVVEITIDEIGTIINEAR